MAARRHSVVTNDRMSQYSVSPPASSIHGCNAAVQTGSATDEETDTSVELADNTIAVSSDGRLTIKPPNVRNQEAQSSLKYIEFEAY